MTPEDLGQLGTLAGIYDLITKGADRRRDPTYDIEKALNKIEDKIHDLLKDKPAETKSTNDDEIPF
jgi:hypothetical protein